MQKESIKFYIKYFYRNLFIAKMNIFNLGPMKIIENKAFAT